MRARARGPTRIPSRTVAPAAPAPPWTRRRGSRGTTGASRAPEGPPALRGRTLRTTRPAGCGTPDPPRGRRRAGSESRSTLRATVPAGSFQDWATEAWAARCTIRSGLNASARRAKPARSRTSRSNHVACGNREGGTVSAGSLAAATSQPSCHGQEVEQVRPDEAGRPGDEDALRRHHPSWTRASRPTKSRSWRTIRSTSSANPVSRRQPSTPLRLRRVAEQQLDLRVPEAVGVHDDDGPAGRAVDRALLDALAAPEKGEAGDRKASTTNSRTVRVSPVAIT